MKPVVTLYLVFLVLLVLLVSIPCQGASWFGMVRAGGSEFSISRTSINMSFSYEDSVRGNVSPVNLTSWGGEIPGHHSRYARIMVNDVRSEQRTGARDGLIGVEEMTRLQSSIDNPITMEQTKYSGSPFITFQFKEEWPVVMASRRTLEYKGEMINDRDFQGNNLDFAGTDYMHNTYLLRDRLSTMKLLNLNLTLRALLVESPANSQDDRDSDGSNGGDEEEGEEGDDLDQDGDKKISEYLVAAEFLPTRQLKYETLSRSSGLAVLKYRQASSDQLSLTRDRVTPLHEGEDWYLGDFDLHFYANMTTLQELFEDQNTSWLSCACPGSINLTLTEPPQES